MWELDAIMAKEPDVVEWRADFFDNIANTAVVLDTANRIKAVVPDTAIIFTIRSVREGGQEIPLSDRQVIELTAAVCKNTSIEYVDCELSKLPEQITYLRGVAKESGTKIIASFHDFNATPEAAVLLQKFDDAERYQLDVAKIAVMPQRLEDVLALLSVTLEAKQRCKIPLITMSMGRYGALSRMIGGVFGSSLTFAIGQTSSAPGQIPIEDLRCVLSIIQKTMSEI
jgi:3-dehydroquinate dehydratase-1